MKERLEGWVRILARTRKMTAAYKAEKERLYALWQTTSMYTQWDTARLAEKRSKKLAQRAESRARDLRLDLFDGLFKGKVFGVAVRVSKPKPILLIPAEGRDALKEWMWTNARVHLKIDEEALLKMVVAGDVPEKLAREGVIPENVTATIARDLSKELEAKS